MTAQGPRPVFFDLTEVLMSSTGKLRYYGIVRVVAEVGRQLARRAPDIRFCVHSPAHDAFFEVSPKRGDDGDIDLAVPQGFRPLRLRKRFYRPNRLRDAALPVVRPLLDGYNRRLWRRHVPDLPRADLDGALYISFSRPKLIVDALDTLTRHNRDWALLPLLHDMIPLHDFFAHRQADFPTNFIGDNRAIMTHADRVLANSAFTRDDILAFSAAGKLPAVSDVVAIPLVHECPDGWEPPVQDPPPGPYLLTVGATTGRKNLEIVFDALLRLEETGRPVPNLCLAGALRKRTREYFEQDRYAPIRDRIFVRHSPNQTDLVALYRGALALVIPSRMEGWGLPAGEALWLGTPALCSTAPVFREVCGDLGLYFDPDQPDELAALVNRLMTEPDMAAGLRARIAAARPTLRDWSSVAEDVLAVIRPAAPA